jgi:hypothetical protein
MNLDPRGHYMVLEPCLNGQIVEESDFLESPVAFHSSHKSGPL